MVYFYLLIFAVAAPIFLLEVIHSRKNLFCNVGHICNLAIEFNGLVSKRVSRNDWPFLLFIPGSEFLSPRH